MLLQSIRIKLWAEAAQMATDQESALVTATRPVAPYNAFYEKESPGWRYGRQYGEMGIVNYGSTNKIKAKHANKGRPCMLIGKGINQPKDCYRFLNLETLKVIASRDVLGLGKTYGEWKGLKKRSEMLTEMKQMKKD